LKKADWMIHDRLCEKIANPHEQGCGCLVRFKTDAVVKKLESSLAQEQARSQRYREALEIIADSNIITDDPMFDAKILVAHAKAALHDGAPINLIDVDRKMIEGTEGK
jgi:hypothetical protein